jgi:hypothetical protein
MQPLDVAYSAFRKYPDHCLRVIMYIANMTMFRAPAHRFNSIRIRRMQVMRSLL